MSRRTIGGLAGAAIAFAVFLIAIGPFVSGDLRAFGIGLFAAAGAMLGERVADR